LGLRAKKRLSGSQALWACVQKKGKTKSETEKKGKGDKEKEGKELGEKGRGGGARKRGKRREKINGAHPLVMRVGLFLCWRSKSKSKSSNFQKKTQKKKSNCEPIGTRLL
jgi:hypothetical protein